MFLTSSSSKRARFCLGSGRKLQSGIERSKKLVYFGLCAPPGETTVFLEEHDEFGPVYVENGDSTGSSCFHRSVTSERKKRTSLSGGDFTRSSARNQERCSPANRTAYSFVSGSSSPIVRWIISTITPRDPRHGEFGEPETRTAS